MDQNDRRAIEGLFDRLNQTAQTHAQRDAEAESFIAGQIARQPGAPYYMAQTIVMQDYALQNAQARLEQLEAELEAARHQAAAPGTQPAGGLFGRLFGGGAQPAPRSLPPRPMAAAQPMMSQPPQGGGFLAGAAQTAMGVAGGVLLGNAIGSMFGGGAAEAAPAPVDAPAEPVQDFEEDAGYEGEDEWE